MHIPIQLKKVNPRNQFRVSEISIREFEGNSISNSYRKAIANAITASLYVLNRENLFPLLSVECKIFEISHLIFTSQNSIDLQNLYCFW
jgi:hypothetical protein